VANVRADTKIRGLEQALKELRKVEPETVKTFRKEARQIAAPTVKKAKEEFRWQASVSSSFQPDRPGGRRRNKPALTPLSGMGNKRPLIKGRLDTRWDPTRALRGITFKLGGPAKKRRGNRAYRMFSIIQSKILKTLNTWHNFAHQITDGVSPAVCVAFSVLCAGC